MLWWLIICTDLSCKLCNYNICNMNWPFCWLGLEFTIEFLWWYTNFCGGGHVRKKVQHGLEWRKMESDYPNLCSLYGPMNIS